MVRICDSTCGFARRSMRYGSTVLVLFAALGASRIAWSSGDDLTPGEKAALLAAGPMSPPAIQRKYLHASLRRLGVEFSADDPLEHLIREWHQAIFGVRNLVMSTPFNPTQSRRDQVARLQQATVAIAGLGAMGSAVTEVLARNGVGGFAIADPEVLEDGNLQRNSLATWLDNGMPKVDAALQMIRAINPFARVDVYPEGITETNAGDFARASDIVVDGLEIYAQDIRATLADAARREKKFFLTAGPVGWSAALMAFDPEGMSFQDYFAVDQPVSRVERWLTRGLAALLHRHHDADLDRLPTPLARFFTGMTPLARQRHDLRLDRIDVRRHEAQSSMTAVDVAAGFQGFQVLAHLLESPDRVTPAPMAYQVHLRDISRSPHSVRVAMRNPKGAESLRGKIARAVLRNVLGRGP